MPTPSTAGLANPVSGGLLPATRAEQSLWLLEKLVPASGVNNLSVAFEVAGTLGEWELQQTVDALITRHDVLRGVFHDADFGLLKRVLKPAECTVVVQEREHTDGAVAAFIAEPFAFDGSPLLRAARFRGPHGDVCCIAVHHIVFDAVSSAVLLDELVEIYESVSGGLGVPETLSEIQHALPPAPVQQESMDFWREALRGFDPATLGLSCGTDDLEEPTLVGDCVPFTLSHPARAAVRQMQHELRAPEAVILLAAYFLLLARHGAGPDLVVGSPADLRGRETSRAIGFHVNTLPIRAKVDLGAGFRELVRQVRDTFLGMIEHAQVPADALLSEAAASDGSWRNTVFRHGFNYVPDFGRDTFEIDGMPARRLVVENGYSKLDLEFFFLVAPETIRVRGVYYTEIFGRDDVVLLLQRYDHLLVSLAEQSDRPAGELPLACPQDQAIIDAANATECPIEPATLPEAIARTVRATPDAVALVDGDRTVTYAELWRAAVATRRLLRESGTARGGVVALSGPRGAELAAAALGVWLHGEAYLPLDPEHPAERTAYLLADSGVATVLATGGVTVPAVDGVTTHAMVPVAAGPAGTPEELEAEELQVDPEGIALLIYTSGSTGRPKGARITHRGEANAIYHHARALSATAADVGLWLVPFAFDPSAVDLYLPLVTGGRVAVGPDTARMDGRELLRMIAATNATIVQASPTTWRLVADHAAAGELAGVRVVSGGDALPATLAGALIETGCELFNAYGPSETTICSTMTRVEPGAASVDIGTPISNTRLFVVDEAGRELPVGVRGDLCIAGEGVCAGYHERPELTAERFGAHPVHGRFYRTGDLASWQPSGTIALHGRIDRQVKLRGNRIELGEVEAVLLDHPAVVAAAVLVAGRHAGGTLTAFVQSTSDDARLAESLWAHAAAMLPRAAVPQELIRLDELPRNANEKVDYLALARLVEQRAARAAGAEANGAPPDDPLVAELVGLWRELLGRGDLGADANFFANGGNSLGGIQLMQRAEQRFGVTVRLNDLYADPTPATFAELVRDPGSRP